MISKQNVIYNKIDKEDYWIYIDQKTNKGIFTPYFKGSCNSFMYDFKSDICRTFHKNPRTYSIIDLSLDGTKVITISVTANDSSNNVLKILEIGTNKVLLEISNMYVYEAYFTANPRYIFIRSSEFNKISVFIYDIEKGKIVYILKENIFIKNGCFNEGRSIFIYPSISNNKAIHYLNFNTLIEIVEEIGYSDIRITQIFKAADKDLLLLDNDESVSLYSNKKLIWKIQFLSFLNHYKGGFFYLKENNKIYLDTPAIIQEKLSDIQNDDMVLYAIDAYSGNITTTQLPAKIKYKKFTKMSDYKLIDTAGNIFDIKTRSAYSFPLQSYK